MRVALRQQQEIAGLQRQRPSAVNTNDAASFEHEVKGNPVRLDNRMIDVERALQPATQVENWAKAGEFNNAAENIHETIALDYEQIEH